MYSSVICFTHKIIRVYRALAFLKELHSVFIKLGYTVIEYNLGVNMISESISTLRSKRL